MAKKREAKDERTGFKMEPARPVRRGNGNRALPRVVPIERGEGLAVYPDDETVKAMEAEGWNAVKVGFKQNDEGDFEELLLEKSDDGTGVSVRFYEGQRVCIHVTVKHHGRAVAKSEPGVCTVRRVGDAFIFGIMDQISIGPKKELETTA